MEFIRNAVLYTYVASLAIARIQKGHTYMNFINELIVAIKNIREIAHSRRILVQNRQGNNSWNAHPKENLLSQNNNIIETNPAPFRKCFNCGNTGHQLISHIEL